MRFLLLSIALFLLLGSVLGICGDTVLDSGEDCDDGNTKDNDECSATCHIVPLENPPAGESMDCIRNLPRHLDGNWEYFDEGTGGWPPIDTPCGGGYKLWAEAWNPPATLRIPFNSFDAGTYVVYFWFLRGTPEDDDERFSITCPDGDFYMFPDLDEDTELPTEKKVLCTFTDHEKEITFTSYKHSVGFDTIQLYPVSALPGAYSVTANAGPNGTISPAGTTGYSPGDRPLYSIAPNPGYEVDQVLLDGTTNLGAITTYTFDPLDADHTLSATFKSVPLMPEDVFKLQIVKIHDVAGIDKKIFYSSEDLQVDVEVLNYSSSIQTPIVSLVINDPDQQVVAFPNSSVTYTVNPNTGAVYSFTFPKANWGRNGIYKLTATLQSTVTESFTANNHDVNYVTLGGSGTALSVPELSPLSVMAVLLVVLTILFSSQKN